MNKFFVFLSALFLSHQVWAVRGNYEDAIRLRKAIEISKTNHPEASVEKIILPVSRGFYQKETMLCWAYSTLNGLETIFLSQNSGKILELSRGFMQYVTMTERFLDKIRGTDNFIRENGTAVDAISLINKWGMIQFAEYPDIASPYYAEISKQIFSQPNQDEQIKVLTLSMDQALAPLPQMTNFQGTQMAKTDFGRALIGNGKWVAYAPSNQEGWRQHPDSDARKGTQAYFMSTARIIAKIKEALQNKIPVEYAANGHSILIYGAEYAENGKPTVYYMKDSYPGYFYTADADKTHTNMLNITTGL